MVDHNTGGLYHGGNLYLYLLSFAIIIQLLQIQWSRKKKRIWKSSQTGPP